MKHILWISAAIFLLQSCDQTKMKLRAPETPVPVTKEAPKDTLHKQNNTAVKGKEKQ